MMGVGITVVISCKQKKLAYVFDKFSRPLSLALKQTYTGGAWGVMVGIQTCMGSDMEGYYIKECVVYMCKNDKGII
jgi:hypothetical protein